jgi:nucleoside-diphosphate-sugar epimerase
MARLGFVIIAGGNDRVLNLIDGRDLVRFIGLVMNHPAAVRETFFASDGEVYRMDNFIHEIARAMNRPVRILRIPFGLMYPITAIVEGWARLTGRKTPVLNPSRLPDFAAKRWLCNSEKAVALLGFQPLYPLPRGVGETYRWYREHGWL